ncbi:MAG: phage integrase N-terminal SAM-like domain-containing protein [Acidobacteria bacterium]|nr:phage integrase N-terminal SAM-like domain-containing protein [Acidobacteriota bacterium]
MPSTANSRPPTYASTTGGFSGDRSAPTAAPRPRAPPRPPLHYSIRTEEAYVQWDRRFILFHKKRHPSELGVEEVRHFLSHLANEGRVSASTQNQALSAILHRD